MVTLAAPLPPNRPLTFVTPTAFTFSDGVQTITNITADFAGILLQTNGTGEITMWFVTVSRLRPGFPEDFIQTVNERGGGDAAGNAVLGLASNIDDPGTWTRASVPDAASTFTLLFLSLTALGVAAYRYKRAAA
jgi:hypothetical protein